MSRYISALIILNVFPILLSGQCYPDRHSTNWFDGWISCEATPNPNTKYGESHWILYDLGHQYQVSKIELWNTNDPAHLDYGIREANIDYSEDGVNWISGGKFNLAKGGGHSRYEDQKGPDLKEAVFRYLLITPLTNWGGTCYGFSEIRMEAELKQETSAVGDLTAGVDFVDPCLQVSVYPNPFIDVSGVHVNSTCNEDIDYQVLDLLGRQMAAGKLTTGSGASFLRLSGQNWPAGTYYLKIQQGKQRLQSRLLKLQ